MKYPQLKRRRLLSNPFVPLLTPNLLAASLKPSGISTCTSCHRTLGLKSSPPIFCARFVVVPFAPTACDPWPSRPHRRCNASSCVICARTCAGNPLPSSRGTGIRNPSPYRLPTPPPLGNPSAAWTSRRRRARDEDIDSVLNVKGLGREGTSCGRMVCRICCIEILQRWIQLTSRKTSFYSLSVSERSETVACLDCFEEHRDLQVHGSGPLMQEAIVDDILTATT